MTEAQDDYKRLHKLSRQTDLLSGIGSLLGWDQETYMPEEAAPIRGEQLQVIASLVHEGQVGRPFVKALSRLVDIKSGKVIAKGLTVPQKAALREWHRDYVKESALPAKFVEEFALLTSQALEVWRSARKDNAYQRFAPFLERIVDMSRRKADYYGYEEHPYDALLDAYEPGMTTACVSKLFGEIRPTVVELLQNIQSKKQVDHGFLHGKFSEKKQIEFAHQLLEALDFNMKRGRLDFSTHPFSSACHPTDSRITTRLHPKSLMSGISVIMHEAGHGMYEMGLPTEYYGSPLGHSVSLGVHESQSRWWETRIGQSKPFWKHFLPKLRKLFPGKLDGIPLQKFYKGLNKVEPTLIRVDADEVTYPLHVILRFEIEQQLIEGTLSVRDVPEAWNALMESLLGIKPPSNAEGCLQDIHWSMGGFGYFPTYTLGNIYAAQLFETFEKEQPDWGKQLAQGDLLTTKQWLHDHIFQHGRQYPPQQLLKKVTGKVLSADPYKKYLVKKYADIYLN